MIQNRLKNALLQNEKYKFISIDKLKLIKSEIENFNNKEQLNNFQKWIISGLYNYDMPVVDFLINSILLIAVPHPFYTNVDFIYKKKKYCCLSLVMSDFEKTEKSLNDLFNNKYHIIKTSGIPLKRMAVQSGLAVYGKNNICYIDEFGSSFSLVAYYTDIQYENTEWDKVNMASICKNCGICLKSCPTGAIKKERFLINNEICLSYMNESSSPFPDWLPTSVHHTVYDCLKCQINCPMNRNQLNNLGKPVEFDESETDILLSGINYENYSDKMKQKAKYLGLDQWPDGISRNLKMLIK